MSHVHRRIVRSIICMVTLCTLPLKAAWAVGQSSPSTYAEARVPSVCVAQLVNTRKDSGCDYLALGIAEGISSRLANAPGLQLVERSCLKSIVEELRLQKLNKANSAATGELGQLIGADYLVVGSYEVVSGRLTVDLRVVEASTGRGILGVTKSGDDRSMVEAAVATEIAVHLGAVAPSTPKERPVPVAATPPDADEALRLFESHDYLSAFRRYCQASDADLGNVELHRRIEKCCVLGHLEARFLDRYLSLTAKYPSMAVLRNYLGNAYLRLRETAKAETEYNRALELDGSFAPPVMNLGIVAVQNGDLGKAVGLFKQYLGSCPKDGIAWRNLGHLYCEMLKAAGLSDPKAEMAQQAEEAFRTALSMRPTDSEAHKGLGRLYAATGEDQRSAECFRKSLILDPSQPDIQATKDTNGESSVADLMEPRDLSECPAIRSAGVAQLTQQVLRAIAEKKPARAAMLAADLSKLLPGNRLARILLARAKAVTGP